ncbi:MAG: ASCH domain-containing protein [Pyrinomonadaceae bacterium]
MMSEEVVEFWNAFCRHRAVEAVTPYQVWFFGNSDEMARELAELVIAGVKTATASLAETNKIEPWNAPIKDGYSVVTDFGGKPLCVIRTTEIRHVPFREVGPGFAADEGEGDRTIEYWRKVHEEYFLKEADKLGFDFTHDSIVCCERFEMLFMSEPPE